ncbi:MAG TPA: hypothetical protein VEF33_01325 [Syntrophales bacterium]|nr:hypothetical protein [Syntrophales bacterium]
MASDKVIIFDYSGTLSLESTLFAKPDHLMKQLAESGLKGMGITSPDIFWREIVDPTWQKGSTTPVGYKKVIENRINSILSQNISDISYANISDAASSFVDSYLNHSRIDRRWQPILSKLGKHPSIRVIIATDHYAEATGYIIKFLREFKIQATAAKDAFAASGTASVVVANSADLGVHKADRRFWEILKTGLNMGDIRQILLIDDFGSNEQKGDSYGIRERVEQRKHDTAKMLQKVFSAEVEAFPFMIENNGGDNAFGELIKQAAVIIDRYLTG